MPARSDTFSVLIAVAVVCVVTLGVFGQVASFEFINYDDQFFVTQNERVTGGLTLDNVRWSFSTSKMGIWHPLTWMSYQLEVSLFGPEAPGVHHTTNMLLHLINAVLVFVLCLRLSGAVWPSMLIAILFSIHPQHVQPVAWISERKEVMAAAFFLVSLNLYVGYRSRPGKRLLYMLSLLAFAIALMCKPSAAPLPVILILIDMFYRLPEDGRGAPVISGFPQNAAGILNLVGNKLPFFVLALLVSAITIYIKKTGHWAEHEETLHLARRLLLMPIGILHYIKSFFVPWPNPIWIPAPDGMPYARSMLSMGALSVVAYGVWNFRHRVPELYFGLLWFVIMWLPVSGIVLVSNYYVADRYTYLPYIGGLFGTVFFARHILHSLNSPPRSGILLSLVVVLLMAVLAYKQTSYWRDAITFFTREAEINPDIPSAPLHVAYSLYEDGRAGEALGLINRSIEIDGNVAKAYALRGDVLRALGRGDEAIAAYQDAISRDVERPDTYVHLGILLLEGGETTAGAVVMEKGLGRFSDDVYLLNHLAYVYGFNLGRIEMSLELYQRALIHDSDNVDALLGLGILHLRAGNTKEGLDRLERVLELDPKNEPAIDAIRAYNPG